MYEVTLSDDLVNFGFDKSKTDAILPEQGDDWKSIHRIKADKTVSAASIMACGGGGDQREGHGNRRADCGRDGPRW